MRSALTLVALLALAGCSLCPDGYMEAPSDGTYGFVQCVEERDE